MPHTPRLASLLAAGTLLATAAWAQPAAAPACDKPVYLAFETSSMDVAPLVAVVLRRQQVRATFFGSASATASGDALDSSWAPWWKARGAEGHAFVSATRDQVQWLGDERGVQPRFRVRPATGAFAGRTFTWDAAKYCDNVAQAADRLGYLTGVQPLPMFRTPDGRASPRLLAAAQACGYRHVGAVPVGFLASAAASAKGPSDQQLAQALARVRPGDVLLAHLGVWSREVPQVPVGLDAFVSGLKAQGFCLATLREHPGLRAAGPAAPR